MRLYRLLHHITLRFTTIEETEANDLNVEAQTAYHEMLDQAKHKVIHNAEATRMNLENKGLENYVPLTLKKLKVEENLVLKSEKWYTRYGFAMVYMIVAPMLQKYTDAGEGDTEGDDMEDLKAFMMYRAMKKSKV